MNINDALLRAECARRVAAERERCAALCRRLRSLDGDFLARAIDNATAVSWSSRA